MSTRCTPGYCNRCRDPSFYEKTGKRCLWGDDLETIYPEFPKYDAYIFATPVYMGTPSGTMINFIDRWRPIYSEMVNFQKVTGFITVAGSYRGGQEFAMMTLMRKLCVHGRLIFAPTATFEVIGGGLMISRITDPTHKLSSGQDGVMEDEMGKKAIRTMVEDVLLLARIIKTGRTQLGITGPISAHKIR